MLNNRIIFLIVLLFLSSCGQEKEPASPAQSQIDEYSKGLNKEGCDLLDKGYVRDFTVAPDDMVLGDVKSKVVLVEYFSPTCPHCVHYHKSIFPEIKEKYIDTNKIAYVIREFIGNKQDFDAASLARCKGDIDNYLKFNDVILTKQDGWAFSKNYREILTNIAGLGGVSPEEFAKCLNDQDKTKILMDNTQLVASMPKFIGTPSFFINGEQFAGRYTMEDLSKVIDEELGKIKE